MRQWWEDVQAILGTRPLRSCPSGSVSEVHQGKGIRAQASRIVEQRACCVPRMTTVTITPSPGVVMIAKQLARARTDERRRAILHQARREFQRVHPNAKTTPELHAGVQGHVVLDLVGQGWTV